MSVNDGNKCIKSLVPQSSTREIRLLHFGLYLHHKICPDIILILRHVPVLRLMDSLLTRLSEAFSSLFAMFITDA